MQHPRHSNDDDDVDMTNEDDSNLARIDVHVRTILAAADSRLFALNTALGHSLPSLPLTDVDITAHIAEIYAYYYVDTSSDDEIPEPLAFAPTASSVRMKRASDG
jgi:hypothetical protein